MTIDRTEPTDHTVAPSRTNETGHSPATTPSCGRRRFLRTAGGLAVAGMLAGCTDGRAGGGSGTNGEGGETSVDDWLAETDNYDAVADRTGEGAVTVAVGPGGNEFVFEPPAIRVDPGTTVTWQWVGSGHHNVVATDGAFDSGDPEAGGTFEHTFGTAGTALYYCEPHESMGMKGAVVVAGSDDGTAADATSSPVSR